MISRQSAFYTHHMQKGEVPVGEHRVYIHNVLCVSVPTSVSGTPKVQQVYRRIMREDVVDGGLKLRYSIPRPLSVSCAIADMLCCLVEREQRAFK